jgi:ethanolamine ammonia-lyase small subunit
MCKKVDKDASTVNKKVLQALSMHTPARFCSHRPQHRSITRPFLSVARLCHFQKQTCPRKRGTAVLTFYGSCSRSVPWRIFYE